MRLQELLEASQNESLEDRFKDLDIRGVVSDSRRVKKGDLFVAVSGAAFNGADFIDQALERGASAVAVEPAQRERVNGHVCCLTVEDPRTFLKDITRKFYGNPSENLRCIGITGTNGKTTVAYLLESVLEEDGKPCGVMGTVNYRAGGKSRPSVNTTPSLVEIHRFLSELVKENVPVCVMEVSSHGLAQGRVDGIDFCTAIFTNLTDDHLDYHENKEEYFAMKSLLFKSLSDEADAVINNDDPYGQKLFSMTKGRILSYGVRKKADVTAKDIQLSLTGTQFRCATKEGEIHLRTRLVGLYNVYNILAAVGGALVEGVPLDKIKSGIERLKGVPGRLERVDCGQDFHVFIDYAHTADALHNVLTTLRRTSDARIILVFGCGGDRDRTKRKEMGRVGCELANHCFVTSDNPRSEDPESIIHEILQGFHNDNFTAIVNREEAIQAALKQANAGDIVLIAGKGHETYQVFKDGTIKFDEKQIVRQQLLC